MIKLIGIHRYYTKRIAIMLVILLLFSTWTSTFVSASEYKTGFSVSESDVPNSEQENLPTNNEDELNNEPSNNPEDEAPVDEIVNEEEKLDIENLAVVDVKRIEIANNTLMMNPGAVQPFQVKAFDEGGNEIPLTEGVAWTADPQIGQISQVGELTAGGILGSVEYGYVTAKYGELEARSLVLVGKVGVVLEDFESMTQNGKTILTTGIINSKSANVQLSSRPDPVVYGEHAAKFTYDMSGTTGTSAAYVSLRDLATGALDRRLEGNPTKLGVWVYGDQNAHWFRARLRNNTGGSFTIDFTTSSNFTWSGWKYVTASMPSNQVGPFKIMDLYLVETKNDNKNAGVLYFDRFSAFYNNTDIFSVDIEGLTPMKVGESKQAQVYITQNGSVAPEQVGSGVTFLSSNPEVASIDDSGQVISHKAGQTTIVALYQNAQPALFELMVSVDDAPLESIEMIGPLTIEKGRTGEVKVFARYSNYPNKINVTGEAVISSSSQNIDIQHGGIVKGLDVGDAIITASYQGKDASYSLTVTEPIPVLDKIELSGLSAMTIGSEQQATVTAYYNVLDQPSHTTDITQNAAFTSSKKAVAEIGPGGQVRALSVGATMITASFQGKTHSYVLVVNKESVAIPKQEMRATWVATVENIDWPSKGPFDKDKQQAEYIAMLDELQATGINAIIMQVKPAADAFYPSEYAPWSKWLTGKQGQDPGYDPLAFMIEESHKRNIEFHAWFNPYRASMEPDINSLIPEHPLRQHQDWLHAYGGRLIMDPGIPETQEYIINGIMEVVNKYDIDAVHFDDYFYPYPVAGVAFPDSESFAKYGQGMTLDNWRRNNVDTLIQDLSIEIKKAKPYVKFGISPFGIWRNKSSDPNGSDTNGTESYSAIYNDTRKWIQEEWIDYVTPQIYWYFNYGPAAYENLVDWWAKQVEGKNVHLYVGHGAYRIGSNDPNWLDPDQMPNQVTFNRNYNNVKGSIFFSTDSIRSNPLGFKDKLQDSLYQYPALVPQMNWLSHNLLNPPQDLMGKVGSSGLKLSWNESQDDTSYYVIYRSEGTIAPDVTNPAHILTKVSRAAGEDQRFEDKTVELSKTYTYLITAVDRLHNESNPETITVEVKEFEKVPRIEFENMSALKVGQSLIVQLLAINEDHTEPVDIKSDVKLTSSNDKVATIDKKGIIKAKKAGKTTITANYKNLFTSYELIVINKSDDPNTIEWIEFSNLTSLLTGDTLQVQLQAIYIDRTESFAINNKVKLASSKEKIATIDKNGLIHAIKEGKTTITAKYKNLTASFELIVANKN